MPTAIRSLRGGEEASRRRRRRRKARRAILKSNNPHLAGGELDNRETGKKGREKGMGKEKKKYGVSPTIPTYKQKFKVRT